MHPSSDARLQVWQNARAARLAALPWLRTDTTAGRPVRYVADELLVLSTHTAAAHTTLAGLGHAPATITTDEIAPGITRLRVTGMDVPAATRALRAGAGSPVAGANHVFLPTPYEMGGPYGPPTPAASFTMPAGPSATASVHVTVVDTGVWTDSPLPVAWYDAGPNDIDDTLDADSDVGHANFITGVVMTGTANARVRIVKVLDANGICTEAQLVAALSALAPTDIVNLSLGGFTIDDLPPLFLANALGNLLTGEDRIVVAAAGNDGNATQPFWPAAFAGGRAPWAGQVVAVAAHDGTNVCSWSNTGPWVSLAAPGSDITSTYVEHDDFPTGLAQWSGTSFAAPHVVAAIAERQPVAGSIVSAAKQMLTDAGARTFSSYPGLV
jgi:thermitase